MRDFRFKTVIFGFVMIVGAGALAMQGGYTRPSYPAIDFSQGQYGSYEEATTAGQTGNAGSVDVLEVPRADFVNISAENHKQIPQKKYAQIALDQSGLGGMINYAGKPSTGGNGILYFTNNGLAIKLSAGDRGEDEAAKLLKAAIKIKEIGRIKGFEMNLPEKVYETGNGTNIQILKQVITPVPGDKKDVAGIMRTYMRDGNPIYLETMKRVGKKLAEFQLSTRPEYRDGYFVGLQHDRHTRTSYQTWPSRRRI